MSTAVTSRNECIFTPESIRTRLESATTVEEREETVDIAIQMGMRFDEIEKYLDWIEASYDETKPPHLK